MGRYDNHVRKNVANARVDRHPVPHFISENTLPADCLEDLLARWPKRAYFRPEVAGNYLLWHEHDIPDNPLRDVVAEVGETLSRAILSRFADWIELRFGPDLGSVKAGFGLMEADPDYGGHVVHSHHYQTPFWLATALLYLDDEPGGHQGTTLCQVDTPAGHDPLEYVTAVSMQSMSWPNRDDVTDAVTADYAGNRMLAFLDSPISFHRVRAARTFGNARRRILRMHFSADPVWCEKLYGLTSDEYFHLRAPGMPIDDPEMVDWNRREIRQLTSAPEMRAEARDAWADEIALEI